MKVTALAACFVLGSLAGCVNRLPSPTNGLITTLDLTLLAPSSGTPAAPNTDLDAVFNLDAFADDGTPYPGDATVDVYVSYGGVLSGVVKVCGDHTDAPIETLTIHGGHLENHALKLPAAYGTTSIWVSERGSHVVGASTPIYFPNPTIVQVQTPPDPAAANATFCSNFDKKFITVDHSTGAGEIIVDSIFNGAVTAVDTGAAAYNALYLFTFGAPATDVVKGATLKGFSGNISKFAGFTELNFPIISVDDTVAPDTSKLPAAVPLAQTDINNLQKLNSLDARTVQVSGQICPVAPPNLNNDATIQKTIDQWIKYNTFVLGKVGCDAFTEFSVALPSKVLGGFDPTKLIGQAATLRGMLKNASGQNAATDPATGAPLTCDAQTPCAMSTSCVNGICYKGAYNFWTVTVRDSSDVNPTQ